MGKSIKIFKSFKDQEMYLLEYFFKMTPSERLQALSKLQRLNSPLEKVKKRITIRNHFLYGH